MKKIMSFVLLYCLCASVFAVDVLGDRIGEGYLSEDVVFKSHGVDLAGTIVMPSGVKPHAAVVFVHGSGEQTRNLYWAKKFADAGVAALVYDKRGVGESKGQYERQQSVSEKNLVLLADDALAGLRHLQKHKALKDAQIGLAGISQAGWIVPLAAEKAKALDFMIIWSGPVCKVSEEDIYSRYTADKDMSRVPPYQEALSARKSKYIWPSFLGKDSSPADSLKTLNTPGLWIFGEQDGSVPVDLSIERLSSLIEQGHDYQYVLFSGLGHNNMNETFDTAMQWVRRLEKN